MSLEDLGNIGEFVAAVVVLVSVIYLAVQIRQNAKAVRTASEHSIVQGWNTALSLAAQSPTNAETFYRGLTAPDELSEIEFSHFALILQNLFNQYENAYFSLFDGTLPERRWKRAERGVFFYSTQPGGQQWWKRSRWLFSEEFQNYIGTRFETDE